MRNDSTIHVMPASTGMMQMTAETDTPLGQARSNFISVQRQLIAAEAALERMYDVRFSDQELANREDEIARLTERRAQRLGELHAIETAMGVPLTPEDAEIDPPEPRRRRLEMLRDQRERDPERRRQAMLRDQRERQAAAAARRP